MTWPAPTRTDHQASRENEGWEPVRNARGRTSGHHALTYEFQLPDGRISQDADLAPARWIDLRANILSHILSDHLDVDEATFWACARHGVKPDRGQPEAPSEALPAELAHLLVTRLRLSRAETRR